MTIQLHDKQGAALNALAEDWAMTSGEIVGWLVDDLLLALDNRKGSTGFADRIRIIKEELAEDARKAGKTQ